MMKTEISYHLFSNTNVSSVGRTKIQFTLSMPVPFVGCKKWENVCGFDKSVVLVV